MNGRFHPGSTPGLIRPAAAAPYLRDMAAVQPPPTPRGGVRRRVYGGRMRETAATTCGGVSWDC